MRFLDRKSFFEHIFADTSRSSKTYGGKPWQAHRPGYLPFLPLRREQSEANITIHRNGVRASGLSVEDPLLSCLDGLVLRMLAARKLFDRRVSGVAKISDQSDLRHRVC